MLCSRYYCLWYKSEPHDILHCTTQSWKFYIIMYIVYPLMQKKRHQKLFIHGKSHTDEKAVIWFWLLSPASVFKKNACHHLWDAEAKIRYLSILPVILLHFVTWTTKWSLFYAMLPNAIARLSVVVGDLQGHLSV